MQQFFYDAQVRRFLLQFTRIFSNFQIEYGPANSDQATLMRVPVRYGDWSRLAQTVQQDNSASSLPATPIMTFYISGMDYDRPRMQEPYYIDRTAVRQRYYNVETDSYETSQGNAFTIERLMPVPYKMSLTLDIWTSNTNQKFQIFEQIATLFNPALEIQSTDSFIDWTSLSVVNLESTTWTSRTIPQGTENPIDIMTMKFSLPIWISSPAMVKKLGVIEKIIISVFDAKGDAAEAIQNSDLLLGTRQKFTPYNYQVLLIGNKLQALKYTAVVDEPNSSTVLPDSPPSNEFWPAILAMYGGFAESGNGGFRPGISQIRLDNQWGTNDQIIATATVDPTDERFLLLDIDIDTLPQDTLPPVDAVIDPLLSGPGDGLPAAVAGQRYLILNDIGDPNNQYPPTAWGSLYAKVNDIIEYDGSIWDVTFGSTTNVTNIQYTTNITTGLQYLWNGTSWVKSYEGLYPAGEWSIVI